MKRFVTHSLSAVLASAGLVGGASAGITLIDTTLTGATNDGTVSAAEYIANYSGVNDGFGDVIGNTAVLGINSDSTGGLQFGLSRGPGAFNDVMVIYIDSITGGAADTNVIDPSADFSLGGTATARLTSAISGNGEFEDSSELVFASGFTADYAIGVSSNFGIVEAGLFSVNAAGTLTYVKDAGLSAPPGDPSATDLEFDIDVSDLDLAGGDSFDFFATYLNNGNAFRSNEFVGVAFGGSNIGNGGATTTLGSGDFNTFVTTPEPASLALVGLGGLAVLGRRRK